MIGVSNSHHDFNPRSPHGERLYANGILAFDIDFNPRSPHGERRVVFPDQFTVFFGFQPTLPARGATFYAFRKRINSTFQPTLPARGATSQTILIPSTLAFQPTLPARGATRYWVQLPEIPEVISTHAPRTGSDK